MGASSLEAAKCKGVTPACTGGGGEGASEGWGASEVGGEWPAVERRGPQEEYAGLLGLTPPHFLRRPRLPYCMRWSDRAMGFLTSHRG